MSRERTVEVYQVAQEEEEKVAAAAAGLALEHCSEEHNYSLSQGEELGAGHFLHKMIILKYPIIPKLLFCATYLCASLNFVSKSQSYIMLLGREKAFFSVFQQKYVFVYFHKI